MRLVFWISAFFVIYTHAGYALGIWLLARLSPKPVRKAAIRPRVSILMAVHNGAELMEAKLRNIDELAYPKELLEVVVASDGSTDGTAEILNSAHTVKAVICPRVGKSEALNRGLEASSHEIAVFTDIRQRIDPNAITELVANFADEEIGCVSGELMFLSEKDGVSGLSTYWKLEKLIRKCESESGSVMGATGALYAVRRSLIRPLPLGTLLDDVYIPMQVLRQGKRVVFEPNAIVWDKITKEMRSEFRRKVRTLAGNFQIVEFMPWVLSDSAVRFRFVSHKFMRLIVPWLLMLLFCLSWMFEHSLIYLSLAVAQTIVYGFALLAAMLPGLETGRWIAAIKAFCMMNAAAAAALFSYAQHRRDPGRLWHVSSASSQAIGPRAQGSATTNS